MGNRKVTLMIIQEQDKGRCNYYEIIGAGKLEVSKKSNYQCGGKEGFTVGVEWGKHGFAGGVLSKEDAMKLVEHILKELDLSKLRKIKLESLK